MFSLYQEEEASYIVVHCGVVTARLRYEIFGTFHPKKIIPHQKHLMVKMLDQVRRGGFIFWIT